MPQFEIQTYESHYRTYQCKAEDREDAKKQFLNGEITEVSHDSGAEVNHIISIEQTTND